MELTPEQMYLDLLKKTLSFMLWPEPPVNIITFNFMRPFYKRLIASALAKAFGVVGLQITQHKVFTEEEKAEGKVWPGYADTMIGMKRLDNLQYCIETVLKEKIPGDFIETGAWRGGACIFMRGALAVYRDKERRVFVADSFEGLPKPDPAKYPQDRGDRHHTFDYLRVSLEEVQHNFARYGLLDDQVVFLKGWFKDTLPVAPIEKLAILRLDGDMYNSTIEGLENLYPKLSKGGFCIIDDYALAGCQKAVHDYRDRHQIHDEIMQIDWTGRYWRKS